MCLELRHFRKLCGCHFENPFLPLTLKLQEALFGGDIFWVFIWLVLEKIVDSVLKKTRCVLHWTTACRQFSGAALVCTGSFSGCRLCIFQPSSLFFQFSHLLFCWLYYLVYLKLFSVLTSFLSDLTCVLA